MSHECFDCDASKTGAALSRGHDQNCLKLLAMWISELAGVKDTYVFAFNKYFEINGGCTSLYTVPKGLACMYAFIREFTVHSVKLYSISQ